MALPIGLEAVTDFVTQTYKDVTDFDSGLYVPIEFEQLAPDVPQTPAEMLAQQIKDAEVEASVRNDGPVLALLAALAKATKPPVKGGETPATPAKFAELQALRDELKRDADGFGDVSRIPPEVDLALAQLKAMVEPKPTAAQVAEQMEAELAAAEAEFIAEMGGAEHVEGAGHVHEHGHEERRGTGVDRAQVKAFLEAYYSESFEPGPVDAPPPARPESEVMAELPRGAQEKLLALPKDERRFLLTADTKHLLVKDQLPTEQQKVFMSLEHHEDRSAYVAMPATEKAFFDKLKPAERTFYLAQSKAGREEFRAMPKEQRQVKAAELQGEVDAAKKQPPEFTAQKLAEQVVEHLGHPKDHALRAKAFTMAANILRQNPGDVHRAEAAVLKAMLQEPHVMTSMLDEVALQLSQEQAPPQTKPHAPGESKPAASAPQEPKSEFKGAAQPEAKGQPAAKPEAKGDVKPEVKAEAKPDPKANAKPEAKAEAKPEVKAEAKPEVKGQPKPDAKPNGAQPQQVPGQPQLPVQAQPRQDGAPAPKPTGKQESKTEGKSESSDAKGSAKSETAAAATPKSGAKSQPGSDGKLQATVRGQSEGRPAQAEEKKTPAGAELKTPSPKTLEGHFLRIRQALPQLARDLAQPGMRRDALVGQLKTAVKASATFVANNPPRGGRRSRAGDETFRPGVLSGF